MSLVNLAGQVAIITGASSGIGAATAVLFSQLGATVALTGRNVANLEKTASRMEVNGEQKKPLLIQADLGLETDTQKIMDETIKAFGRLDILVNNAGVIELGGIENTSLEQYDRIMNVNVRAMYHLTMLATPHLVKTRGNIVNVSSVNGMRSFPGVLAYNISKAAVDQFTRCVALDLAPKQVRVNCVNPGVTITELQKRGGLSDEAYAKFLERSKETHAMGRAGLPEEVAQAIAFLASPSASFSTGISLPVDGGRHAILSSLNELTVHAVAMETLRAFHSQDGPDGSRNALGQVLFPSNVATRSTT
eukprot:maker-scaffold83_size396513-snap-gene-1.17 protein:Tk00960 transcript:maker-scaffold83_size396513-snap-gene-1.17-mRNA-1 annotation:"hypothetical protein LOTGIDRAFT_236007"